MQRLLRVLAVLVFVAALAIIFGWAVTWKNHVVPQTVAQDTRLPFVEIDGYRFHAQTFGDPMAPVVVVLHGGPGGDYRNLLPLQDLAPDFYTVFYDQRGSGLSARLEDPSTITLQSSIDDLQAIIDHYAAGRKVTLLGHSWGAMLAVAYTAQHPDRVEAMVLAEPGYLTPDLATETMPRIMPAMSLSTALAATKAFFEVLHVEGPDDDARYDYFVLRMATGGEEAWASGYWCGGVAPPAARELWRVGANAQASILAGATREDGTYDFDMTSGIESFTGRTLLMASSCNKILGDPYQRRHQELLESKGLAVDYQIVEGSGHLMFSERPASITRVWRYLKDGTQEIERNDTPAEVSPGTVAVPPV